MEPQKYCGIGLMTGTSLDALDICAVEFEHADLNWSYKFLATKEVALPSDLRSRIKSALKLGVEAYLDLDNDLGIFYGRETASFIQENKLEISWIGCHGQTILHKPDQGYSVQAVNLAQLAAITGIDTIGDFRNTDIALGGQGAPLVPMGERHLFKEYNYLINLGGICNIGVHHNGKSLGYDVSGCNLVLNALAEKAGMPYDAGGKMARAGKLIPDLFNALNDEPYFAKSYPKSLDAAWVIQKQAKLCLNWNCSLSDAIHTFVRHISLQLANAIKAHGIEGKVLLSGGGAFNHFLVECIKAQTNLVVDAKDENLLSFKESLIFAFLGLLRKLEIENTYASVTGARKNSISGCLYKGQ